MGGRCVWGGGADGESVRSLWHFYVQFVESSKFSGREKKPKTLKYYQKINNV